MDPLTLSSWQNYTPSTTTKVVFGKEEEQQGGKEKDEEENEGKNPKRLSLFSPIPEEDLIEGGGGEKEDSVLFAYHDDVVERMKPMKREVTPFPMNVELNQQVFLWFVLIFIYLFFFIFFFF